MKWLCALLLSALIGTTPAAEQPVVDFTGHYELAKRSTAAFALDVKQKEKGAEISFSAAHKDGSGAAPDGDGNGRVNDKGELVFTFTDSFQNTGTAILRRDGRRFRLAMKMTKVLEPRAVVFYGDLSLKRIR